MKRTSMLSLSYPYDRQNSSSVALAILPITSQHINNISSQRIANDCKIDLLPVTTVAQ